MAPPEYGDRSVGRRGHRAGGGARGRPAGSRPDADGGTTFTTTSGQAMTFARGPVWIVFADTP